ncbi:MAG: aromatic-ring-hydroxylating dioxygenase subunit beta [Gammaproteobacteria bacterium]|nr:aromatic-ring-hydroxylating dioxygenase subunit beta [Gammaproteobacteria bacterium]
MSVDIREIEDFLYAEADLLDRTDLENWMALFTDDGTYWMPVREDQDDPLNEISILYENRTLMAIRCNNFGHRLAPSMEYPVRCNHIISAVRVTGEDEARGLLTVTSKFQAVVCYREQTLYAGRYTHRLQKEPDGYKIRQKRVDLINCDANHKSLLIYI